MNIMINYIPHKQKHNGWMTHTDRTSMQRHNDWP